MRHRARAGAALARLGLAVGQGDVLVELSERGACTQAQLAAAAGCEPPTITEAVRKLEEKGLVTRTSRAGDPALHPLAPCLFCKKLVDILQRVDEHPDFDRRPTKSRASMLSKNRARTPRDSCG